MRRRPVPRELHTLVVRRAAQLPGESGPQGHVKAGMLTLSCALGQAGITRDKREGDRATPTGSLPILFGYFRADRIARPRCRLPLRPIDRDLGWCDDPRAATYNRAGRLPMRAGHERMWRDDGLYDVVLVLGYNLAPRQVGKGSAIFFHCAKPGAGRSLKPTLGCVALKPDDMRRLLGRLSGRARLLVL